MTKEETRRKPVSTATNRRQDIALEQTSGNFALIDTLRKWGITFFSGVNGGGLIHVAKHLAHWRQPLGPALRASGNLNNSNPSRYGAAAGFGLEIRAGRMTISPTMRFTRWAADQSSASMATNRNQAELLFGFRF